MKHSDTNTNNGEIAEINQILKMPYLDKDKDDKIEIQCDQVVNDLKDLRESKKITTAKLAEMTGIQQPNITRMETGASRPNLKTLVTIADALDAEIKVVKKKQK